MPESPIVPGALMPFDGMDIPWLLRMRSETRRDHPFLICVPREVRLVEEMPRSTLEKVQRLSCGRCWGSVGDERESITAMAV